MKERNEKMARRTAKRRAWTAGEVRQLRELTRQQMPIARMARTLRRTESATRQKAYGLGLSLRRKKASRSGARRRGR
jgi:hypothetical protein